MIINGDVHRLRIRRTDPGDGARYIVVSGSSSAPMIWGMDRDAAVIVESELDGLLVNQEVGDLAGVVALGSAHMKPDRPNHEVLKGMVRILVALDSDEAGATSSWGWWMEEYKQAMRWPCICGKDPSEARRNGLDLRKWVVAGIFSSFD